MKNFNRTIRRGGWVVLLICGFSLIAIQAQQRRRKPSRRASNPVRTTTAPPATSGIVSEPSIIANPDGEPEAIPAPTPAPRRSEKNTARPLTLQDVVIEQQTLRRTVRDLSQQVETLNNRLSGMDNDQRELIDIEKLSRAEQYAESLRAQLRDVAGKEIDLQARVEQNEYETRPEMIDRSLAGIGTLRPDELREQRRRQLESERRRLQEQLTLMQTSRQRLEQAIATAELEVNRLRERLNNPERYRNATPADTNAAPVSAPTINGVTNPTNGISATPPTANPPAVNPPQS